MREPPVGLSDAAVLAQVQRLWRPSATEIAYLPVGFGAHHWVCGEAAGPCLFVTLDALQPKRTPEALEAAYAGAAELAAAGLELVLPSLTTAVGGFTAPFAGGALSATAWKGGSSPKALDVEWTHAALMRLHRADPPPRIPRWKPLVGQEFGELCRQLVGSEWGLGPFGPAARAAIAAGLSNIETWTARYHQLAASAQARRWVATHGEPHSGNQLVAEDGSRLLVDWESLKLAPPELDLRVLREAGAPVAADEEMLELFRIEWRLDEINQYGAWFAAPHAGTRDDEIAFAGLLEQLDPTR